MNDQLCSECLKKRERCRPVVKRVDGTIDYTCPQCWKRLGYDEFLYLHKVPYATQ